MLLSAVNIAVSVCEDSVYNTWDLILPEGYVAVVDDSKKAYDVVVVRRKDARDTSERWFGAATVESSVVGGSSGQQDVRISNIVEVGEVEYLPQCFSAPQMPSTSCSAKIPAKGKRKKIETPAPVAIKRRFEFEDQPIVLPKGWACTLMTTILNMLWEMKLKLLLLAEGAVVVVLRQSFSRVPDICTYHDHSAILF